MSQPSKDATLQAEKLFDVDRFDFGTLNNAKGIVVDFQEVEYIASENVRGLVLWLMEVKQKFPKMTLTFENVFPTVYRQFILLQAAIPDNFEIRSCYIPYFCDPCGEDDRRLVKTSDLHKAKCFEDGLRPGPKCPKCNAEMDPDIDSSDIQYFSAMLGKKKQTA